MKYTYFTDIEKVVQWTYDNQNLFYDKNNAEYGNEESLWPTSRADNIRKMDTYPAATILEQGHFEQINIAELLLCINNAKDSTRPSQNSEFLKMTSTSKKVINILLLGRVLDGDDSNGSFVVSAKKATNQYKDTHQVLYSYFDEKFKLSGRPNGGIKTIKYLPGRTVSYAQICNATQKFNNSITHSGIKKGLNDLVKYGLVECVDKEEMLYKLNFIECKKFLQKCCEESRTI